MSQDLLYLDVEAKGVEKVAFEAKLSDNADTWPQEVLDEAVKQHPYLATFDIVPNMTEVDGERGYGLGYLQVSNKSNRPAHGPGGESLQRSYGVKTIKVPIVIKEAKLSPLDVFVDTKGEPCPMTEDRLRAALYRPQLFDSARKSPGDSTIVEELWPPTGRHRSMFGAQVVDAPSTKLSSLKPEFIIQAIEPTILQGDLDRIAQEMEKDAELTRSLVHNEATLPFISFLGQVQPTTAHDVAKVAGASIQPDVIQVEREGEAYILKMAASQAFAPKEVEADRPTMVERAGEDMVQQADQFGAATKSVDPVVHDKLEDEKVGVVEDFGQYRVKTHDGKELVGWVFPTVLDFEGTALMMTIFTNGSASSVQDQIAGSFAGKSPNIIRSKPDGYGFFYRVTSTGGVVAFIPSEIEGRAEDENGTTYMVNTVMGEPWKVRLVPGLNEIAEMGEGEVALPGDVRWAPLRDPAVPLVESPEEFVKISHILNRENTVTFISDHGKTWSLRGGANVTKLAHEWREGLGGADAMFMAAALGLEPSYAVSTLVKAAKEGSATVQGCRPLHFPEEKLAAARAQSAELWKQMPPRPCLLKEAASLEDITTVDRVLSLGFLNPENVAVFIDYLPDLEEAVKKLATLLVATRLGLQDLPETSVKSAMERVDEVIQGLQKLVHRQANA